MQCFSITPSFDITNNCLMSGKPEYEIMQTAWRERNPGARIKAAKEAIVLNPECATAYILLAEEEVCQNVCEVCLDVIYRPWISMRQRSNLRKLFA